jgi:hypothetical protein
MRGFAVTEQEPQPLAPVSKPDDFKIPSEAAV